ncbi:MAG: YdcF family protein [Clostridiales bacterium]|nr:YdcF family protein [Clostridiales bacterium]
MKFILLSFGILLLLWYLAPLAAGIFNMGNAVGIIGSALLIAFSVYYDKIPLLFKRGVCVALVFVILAVIIPFSANMAKYANYKPAAGAQTVIVLGCKVNGSTPSKYLYDRCEKAAQYLNENPGAVAVLSGGQGSDEDISEAQCMENVLLQFGIDESRLYKEENSTSTSENIAFCAEIIEQQGLSRDVLVVTNEFHEYRASLICGEYGLNFHSLCSRSSFFTFLTYYTRELFAVIKHFAT